MLYPTEVPKEHPIFPKAIPEIGQSVPSSDAVGHYWFALAQYYERILAFYANPRTYEEWTPAPSEFMIDGVIPIWLDEGKLAKKALEHSSALTYLDELSKSSYEELKIE